MASPDDIKTALENSLSAASRDRENCACHADQDALGRQLANHPDPHVRIIAHMSNRQLALSEQMADTTKLVFKVAGVVHTLQQHVESMTGRMQQVERALEELTASVDKLTSSVTVASSQHASMHARIGRLEDLVGQPSEEATPSA